LPFVKSIIIISFLIVTNFLFSQGVITIKYIDSTSLKADTFIGIDDFENYYYTIDNALYKKNEKQVFSYSNIQLGSITSVDIINPLKILLFYRDFNTIVILDNQLNELTDAINLTTETFAKNVAFVTISSNNNLWIYSLDDNILSLWNYDTRQIVYDSQPLNFYQDDFEVNTQVSNYQNCWLISKNTMLKFDEYGNYLETINLQNISNFKIFENGFIYLKEDVIYYYKNNSSIKISGVNNKHFSTNYFVNKNKLYFFDSNMLYKYSVLKK